MCAKHSIVIEATKTAYTAQQSTDYYNYDQEWVHLLAAPLIQDVALLVLEMVYEVVTLGHFMAYIGHLGVVHLLWNACGKQIVFIFVDSLLFNISGETINEFTVIY